MNVKNDDEDSSRHHSFLFRNGAIEATSMQSGMKAPRIRKQLLAHKSPCKEKVQLLECHLSNHVV